MNKQISNPSLNITFPTFQDSGQYVCSAKDYQTTVHSQPINLTVIGGKYHHIVNYISNKILIIVEFIIGSRWDRTPILNLAQLKKET